MANNDVIDSLQKMVAGEISGIHTSTVGKVVSYDSSKGLASVKPSIKYKTANGDSYDYPIIVNVPVFFPTGGDTQITYPIKAGDDCCLIFSERSMDDWLSGGSSSDPRKFDLTDCMAFVGMKPSRSTNNTNIEITNGSCTLSVGKNSITSNKDIIINGISFLGHVHGGVATGSGNTSTPE